MSTRKRRQGDHYIFIYTEDGLKANVEKLTTECKESTWLRIQLEGNDELLLGCIYRSPQSVPENNRQLRSLIREACQNKSSHLLMVGDFNYPDIDWSSWTTTGDSTETDEYRFIEALRDGYLYQHVTQDTRGRGSNTPHLSNKNFDRALSTITVTREEVKKKLVQLKIDKSQGPDKIHPRLLKELAHELSDPLTKIFNTSLKQGRLPTIWKRAQVTAIFKKGSRKEPCNYRPVSLTCIACKVLEPIIRDHLMDHLKRNKLFSNRQYRFIGGRSTGLQMLKVLDKWTEIMDRGGEIDVIYLDFMKAFDTVPYRRLISKLASYGIQGEVLGWIKAFLCDRRQRVAVRGAFSDWLAVLSGIPQGSVLGPFLFVLYINDLPDNIRSEVFMFADDTKVFREIRDDTDRATLQADLDELQTWSTKWLLKFHPDKCKTMTVTRKKESEARSYAMKKKVDGAEMEHVLTKVDSEKDLGIKVDAKLSFEQHINDKVNKANQMMGLMRRSFIYLDKENFRWLYKAIVRPHVEYINTVWSPIRKNDINTIENVQRRATKMIPGLRDMSYPERLRALKLPTLAYRRLRQDMIETFKVVKEIHDPEAAPHMSMV